MSEHDLGGSPPPPTGAAPVAAVSASALVSNIPFALDDVAHASAPPALAYDGWGHGAEWVQAVLADAGIDGAALDRLSAEVLYGLAGPDSAVRPVMRLSGRVLSVKALRAGEGVSYGYAHRAAHDTTIALVSGGYAQGIVRAVGNRVDVLVDGARRRIVGRVAMDVCVVDVGQALVARGDEVIFFGDPVRGEPPVTEWSAALGWTPGEIVAAVGRRSTRAAHT